MAILLFSFSSDANRAYKANFKQISNLDIENCAYGLQSSSYFLNIFVSVAIPCKTISFLPLDW